MTPQAAELARQNARATRIAFMVAGACGEFAVQPLAPFPVWLAMLALFVVVALAAVGQPFAAVADGTDGTNRNRRVWPVRQLVAVVVIALAGAEALTQLRPGDVQSEGRTLALLMLFVQFAHALASRTRRETALGCGVVVATLAVAAVFGGDVTLIAPMALALAGVAVTAALLQRGVLLESATAVSAGSPASVVRACVAPLASALAIGALIFLALPDTSGLRVRSSLGGSGRLSGPAADRGVSGVGAVGAGTLDLNARGALSDAPVLEVDASAPRYWQGAVFADFDGRSWRSSRQGGLLLWTPDDGMLRPAGAPAPVRFRTDHATVLGGVDVVLAPGAPTGYAGPGTVVSDPDGNARFVGDGPDRNAGYDVASVLAGASDDALRAAAGADVDDPRWTAVPSVMAPRVRALAVQLTASASNRFDAVAAVEDYLKATETYDINSPLPRRGDDPIDDFLFVSHRGFCEQFATAAVMLLRSVGVPARLVTGYAFGDTTSRPGERIFRQRDAHAWVQVYYPGVGWVASDATPSGAAGAASSGAASVRERIAGALRAAWKRIPHGRVGAFVAVAAAFAIGAALVLLAGRGLARRRQRARATGRPDDGPVLAAYLRLERALAAQERARAPGETFGEFARRLGGLAVGAGEVARAMRCLEQECYGGRGRQPAPAEVAAAVAVFDRLRAAARDDVPVVVGNAPRR
ncbi:MAG TPA: DUF3488 and transglutaminase-like domain-containing protein [Acidothermaceae bacterium]